MQSQADIFLNTETPFDIICRLAKEGKTNDLNNYKADINKFQNGYTPVMLLAEQGDEAAVKLLITHFKARKEHAVQGAARGGHEDLTYTLIGNDLNLLNLGAQGAAWGGHLQLTERLLLNGAEASFVAWGAGRGGHRELLELILEAGIDEDKVTIQYALEGAIIGDHLGFINELYIIGSPLLNESDLTEIYKKEMHNQAKNVESAFHYISMIQCPSLCKLLVEEATKKNKSLDGEALLASTNKLDVLMRIYSLTFAQAKGCLLIEIKPELNTLFSDYMTGKISLKKAVSHSLGFTKLSNKELARLFVLNKNLRSLISLRDCELAVRNATKLFFNNSFKSTMSTGENEKGNEKEKEIDPGEDFLEKIRAATKTYTETVSLVNPELKGLFAKKAKLQKLRDENAKLGELDAEDVEAQLPNLPPQFPFQTFIKSEDYIFFLQVIPHLLNDVLPPPELIFEIATFISNRPYKENRDHYTNNTHAKRLCEFSIRCASQRFFNSSFEVESCISDHQSRLTEKDYLGETEKAISRYKTRLH